MSVGLRAITNIKLLREIRSKHPGIYSAEEFIKLTPGTVFFAVNEGESGVGEIERKELVRIINPEPGAKDSDAWLKYEARPGHLGGRRTGFVDDLFFGGKACFLSEGQAWSYQRNLRLCKYSLYGVI